ncbi:related to cell division protein CDC50 [Rhynchosporium agropyri]|uniref:Related to cell division protein CDC50 n=1 Tax=Rhynchosporium agropyri TaxID=914238 RepID=A0A1E1LMC7_9HELO|nr:related to cell division protein CDC50 [Rhynchosporium agropyri]
MADPQPGMVHEDSISSQDPNNTAEKTKTKSRKPANTAFRQQRLKAWQPILTPKTVLPLFFAIGIIFAPIGGGLLYASAQVQEIILDYSKCYADAPDYPMVAPMKDKDVTLNFNKNSSNTIRSEPTWSKRRIDVSYGPPEQNISVSTTQCTINFTIPNAMNPPVLFYYRLTNFYQNHRRYAKSFSTDQLKGTAVSADSIDGGDCEPLTVEMVDGVKKPYYPCGLAANSVFNDTFSSPVLLNVPGRPTSNETYDMESKKGISWESDRELYGESKYKWSDVLVPPNWQERYPKGYSKEYHPVLKEDESFQVWMRLAGLPTFSKLAQRNDKDVMRAGTYSMNIDHRTFPPPSPSPSFILPLPINTLFQTTNLKPNHKLTTLDFNVIEYGGTKSVIISTRTVMGGKNPFLGIAYIVVGAICILLGTLFTITHLIKPRKLGDHTYLSWNNEAPGASTAAGVTAAGEGRA